MERIRWHYATTSGAEDFKINSNSTSRQVRLLLEPHPEQDGVFATRPLTESSRRQKRDCRSGN
jgi:hypothetical protein